MREKEAEEWANMRREYESKKIEWEAGEQDEIRRIEIGERKREWFEKKK